MERCIRWFVKVNYSTSPSSAFQGGGVYTLARKGFEGLNAGEGLKLPGLLPPAIVRIVTEEGEIP